MIQLRQPTDFPRPFYVSTPDREREESDERLRELGEEIASLPWPQRARLLKRLRERDDLR